MTSSIKIRILIVDDSATIRSALKIMIRKQEDMEVIGTASDGREGVRLAELHKPDVILMDLEMPHMNGIEAVKAIMAENPVPILVFSSIARESTPQTLAALDAGAVDYVTKDTTNSALNIGKLKTILLEKIRSLTEAKKDVRTNAAQRLVQNQQNFSHYLSKHKGAQVLDSIARTSTQSQSPTLIRKKAELQPQKRTSSRASLGKKPIDLLVIGSSTGGPQALQTVLSRIPENFPVPTLVVQHMPATFSESFSQHLDTRCPAKVLLAEDKKTLEAGTITIAPGGQHLLVSKRASKLYINLNSQEIEDILHKPSVEVTLNSVFEALGNKVLVTILTGMGRDGAIATQKLHNAGAGVLAQNEETCVVYGMPRAVVELGAADLVLPIEEIGDTLVEIITKSHGQGKSKA